MWIFNNGRTYSSNILRSSVESFGPLFSWALTALNCLNFSTHVDISREVRYYIINLNNNLNRNWYVMKVQFWVKIAVILTDN